MEYLPKRKGPNYDLLQKIFEQIEAIDKGKLSLALTKLANKRMTAHLLLLLLQKKKLLLVVVTHMRSYLLSKIPSKKMNLFRIPTKKSPLLLTKYKIRETLRLGIITLDLLIWISNMKKEANSKIETLTKDLFMAGTLTVNQSIKCYLP